MPRPGVEVTVQQARPVRRAATDTSTWFFADVAERGDHLAPISVIGPSGAERALGAKVAYSLARDAMEVYGGNAYFARVVGPNPVYATLNLAGTGTTLVVNAKSVGEWANGAANGLSVEVVAGPSGGSFRVLIIRLAGTEVERTPEYDDRLNFVTWSQSSEYVNIVAGGGSGVPTVAGAANLAGGTDDRGNAGDAQWKAALSRFPISLGPGQLTMLGRTTTQAHLDTLEVAADASERVAILDSPNVIAKASLLTAAAGARASADNEWGGLFGPWLSYPGTAAGTTRTIPPSPFVARSIAINDGIYGPNQPSAGDYGRLTDALGLGVTGAPLTDGDYEDLNDAGINMIRVEDSVPTIFGWRTLANKTTAPLDWMLSNKRLETLIRAEARSVGRNFLFRRIDGQGVTLAAWDSALTGRMMALYLNGDLYPDPADPRPETAFVVETDSVNTEETLADGQLIAEIAYRPSPFAELVKIRVIHVPLGVPVAAV